MANRKRTNPVQFYLDDEEQYILDEKFKLSGIFKKLQYGAWTYQLKSEPDCQAGKQHRKHLSGRYGRSKGVDE